MSFICDAKNLADYLKKCKKYGIWAMTKNKNPDLFIKNLKGYLINCLRCQLDGSNIATSNELYKIAVKNKFKVEKSNNFIQCN